MGKRRNEREIRQAAQADPYEPVLPVPVDDVPEPPPIPSGLSPKPAPVSTGYLIWYETSPGTVVTIVSADASEALHLARAHRGVVAEVPLLADYQDMPEPMPAHPDGQECPRDRGLNWLDGVTSVLADRDAPPGEVVISETRRLLCGCWWVTYYCYGAPALEALREARPATSLSFLAPEAGWYHVQGDKVTRVEP